MSMGYGLWDMRYGLLIIKFNKNSQIKSHIP